MKRVIVEAVWSVMFVLVFCYVAQAQEAQDVQQPKPAAAVPFGPGAKIHIVKMEGGLDGFLVAEITKKKVPVTIVLDEESADFIMTGGGSERKGSWHEGWLSAEKDKASGSVMVVSKATKQLVWAEEAGDRSLMWGSLARGGPRKVASRIADRLKDHLKKQKATGMRSGMVRGAFPLPLCFWEDK
jgi:hypothetical protein